MGEKSDYQRLGSAEEDDEALSARPATFPEGAGRRSPRLLNGNSGPPRQEMPPGVQAAPGQRVSTAGPRGCWVPTGLVRGCLGSPVPLRLNRSSVLGVLWGGRWYTRLKGACHPQWQLL